MKFRKIFPAKIAVAIAVASMLGASAGAQSEAEQVSADASAVKLANPVIDLTKEPDAPAGAVPIVPALETPAETSAPVEIPPPAPKFLPPEAHRAFLFEAIPQDFSDASYADATEKLLAAYEKNTGRKLVPGAKKKVALKIYTSSGRGIATPKGLVRAVRAELEKRGFARENVLIVDLSERNLRDAKFLPPFRKPNDMFWENSPVVALDTGKFYNQKWFYENNVPSSENPLAETAEDLENERKSFLPIPLMFEVDFWINLPVATDSTALGVSCALANATIWNIGNQKRFLSSPANAALVTVGVATIPEFKAKFELTILSLEKYQFIGGPKFDENYALSEPQIWLSANPVIIDYLMWRRMNTARAKNRFDLILPEPPVFSMASKGTVSLGSCLSSEIKLVNVSEEKK